MYDEDDKPLSKGDKIFFAILGTCILVAALGLAAIFFVDAKHQDACFEKWGSYRCPDIHTQEYRFRFN
jgi:hypothetical protein